MRLERLRDIPLRWVIATAVVGAVAGMILLLLTFRAAHRNDQVLKATAIRVEQQRKARLRQLNRINKAQCESLRNIYTLLRLTIVQSDQRIEEMAYYRAHPVEAQEQHDRNQALLLQFRDPPCPYNIRVQP
jgi:hypothetical protein